MQRRWHKRNIHPGTVNQNTVADLITTKNQYEGFGLFLAGGEKSNEGFLT